MGVNLAEILAEERVEKDFAGTSSGTVKEDAGTKGQLPCAAETARAMPKPAVAPLLVQSDLKPAVSFVVYKQAQICKKRVGANV